MCVGVIIFAHGHIYVSSKQRQPKGLTPLSGDSPNFCLMAQCLADSNIKNLHKEHLCRFYLLSMN